MSVSVNSNIMSMNAFSQLSRSREALGTSFARLSSGMRINSSADDAAGLGIAKSLNAQIRSMGAAERNANDAISMIQTADGGAEQVHGLLIRMRELAVQASTGSLNSQDRVNIEQEYGANLLEMVRVTNSVNFNGIDLLKGSATLSFQVGTGTGANDKIEVDFGHADPTSLGIDGSYVNDVTNAQAGITALDNAIKTVSGVRAKFGAGMNRLTSTVSTLQLMQANTSASLSRIQDTDVALETASLSRNQVLSQAGTAVLAQANQTSQVAMTLLRG